MPNKYANLIDKPLRAEIAKQVSQKFPEFEVRFYGRFTLGLKIDLERGRRIDKSIIKILIEQIDKAVLLAVKNMDTSGRVAYPLFRLSSWVVLNKLDGSVVVDLMFVPGDSTSTTVNEMKAARMFVSRGLEGGRDMQDILREARQRYAVDDGWLTSVALEMADDSNL